MALDFFAGCLGGCAGVIVGHPLDTVKIHLQTQDFKNPKYRGSLHCLKTLVQTQGIRGVYRGMSSPLAGVAAINAVVFGVQGNVQRSCSDPDSLRTHALAGATAGLMQSFVCSPMELAKSRLQVETKGSVGPSQLLAQIYRNDGVRGVFKGLNLTVAREVPSYAAYFWTYEALTRSQTGVVSTFDMLMAGGLAGTVSWILTYPVDVIKSRCQLDITGRYNNAFDCLRKSVKAEGFSFLFRGLTPTIIRAFPVNAVTFTVVTWTIRLFTSETTKTCPNISISINLPEKMTN